MQCCKVSAFLAMDFSTVLNSGERPKEPPKQSSKGVWWLMEKILLHVSSPSLGRMSQDMSSCVICYSS